mmetsp:Transcript_31190/g.27448  ORF Transcript_31190/g.27448 Transcript_31190/m.27448 type:complete len:211 (-) Transcript_31190:75-707(-)
MLSLIISYFLIAFSNGDCAYFLGSLGLPEPINTCSDYTSSGTAYSQQAVCILSTSLDYAIYTGSGCSGEAQDNNEIFEIGSAQDTLTACSGSCDGVTARLKVTDCGTQASCAADCDGDYQTLLVAVDTCYEINNSTYGRVTCTNSGMTALTYTDEDCTMGEETANSLTVGCGEDDPNTYYAMEECPLDDSSANTMGLFVVAVLVIISFIY